MSRSNNRRRNHNERHAPKTLRPDRVYRRKDRSWMDEVDVMEDGNWDLVKNNEDAQASGR